MGKINKRGTYKCEICGEEFRIKYNYLMHKQKHERRKPRQK